MGKGERERRRKDLNYKNGIRLPASKANHISPISFSDRSRLLSHIDHI